MGSIDTSHNTADLGTKFHSGERLQELMRMMPIVVGELEPTMLPKKLLGTLFSASQVTQVQGNDESTAVAQYKEKYEGDGLLLRVRHRCACEGLGSARATRSRR